MADNARELVKQAEQKLKGGGFLSFLGGGPNYSDAQDLYQKAANQYKLVKDWNGAAECFAQCARCAKEGGSQLDEANFYKDAGDVLKKVSTAGAIEQYEKAIAINSAGGRFSNAGKLLLSMAELHESERLAHKETKALYKRAAEMFELDEHGKTSYSKCILKVAEYSAKDGEYDEAIRIFESEGQKATANTLLQYGAKDHFFRAGILHLVVGDPVTIQMARDKYSSWDPRFAGSREGELLDAMAAAVESRDADAFVDKLGEYDAVTKLDAWKTEFLVKVKEQLTGSGGLDDGPDLS